MELKGQKVSKILPNKYGVESPYLKMEIYPKSNDLKSICVRISMDLAWSDVAREEEFYEKARKNINEAISKCKTDEDKKELLNFLEQASKIGEIGEMFYAEYKDIINISEKVTYFDKEKKRIYSEYFGVKHRPSDPMLAIECSSLLTYYALADLSRTRESYRECRLRILNILKNCKTSESLNQFFDFIDETSDIGDIGALFYVDTVQYMESGNYQRIENELNQEVLAEEKESIPDEDKINNKAEEKVQEFDEELKKTTKKYMELKEESNIEIEDLESILRRYRQLEDQIIEIQRYMDSNTRFNYEIELEERIKEVRSDISSLEELDQIVKSF